MKSTRDLGALLARTVRMVDAPIAPPTRGVYLMKALLRNISAAEIIN